MKIPWCAALITTAILTPLPALCDATIPTADQPGSQDHPLLRRYEGSFIVSHDHQSFAEFTLPLSRLEPVPGKRANHNNEMYEPKQKKSLEGAYTRLVYLLPEGRINRMSKQSAGVSCSSASPRTVAASQVWLPKEAAAQ